jgi:HD superfamily phosphohydrolase
MDKKNSHRALNINDPVHGIIQFHCSPQFPMRDILNHPKIQRLRHIKQLGMADLVFPGAVHTRFNHSLGAAYLASRILSQLYPSSVHKDNILTTILAALLHDIGHGPFSHAFEMLTQESFIEPITHEDWTPYFLKALDSVLDAQTLCSIESIILHQKKTTTGLSYPYRDIVSSQLDADRLDYLLRDSHFCGVSYGHYDLNWLLNCLTCVTDVEGNQRLGISTKGVGAVEGFLMARRLMTKSIYHHSTVSLLQFLTMCFLKESCLLVHESSVQAYCPKPLRIFLEGLGLYRLNKINKKQFMVTYFPQYAILTDHSVYQWIENIVLYSDKFPLHLSSIAKKLYNRILPSIFRIPKDKIILLRKKIDDLMTSHALAPWEIGLIENNFITYKDSEALILVKNTVVSEVSERSFLIQSLANQEESSAFLYIDNKLLANRLIRKRIKELTA